MRLVSEGGRDVGRLGVDIASERPIYAVGANARVQAREPIQEAFDRK